MANFENLWSSRRRWKWALQLQEVVADRCKIDLKASWTIDMEKSPLPPKRVARLRGYEKNGVPDATLEVDLNSWIQDVDSWFGFRVWIQSLWIHGLKVNGVDSGSGSEIPGLESGFYLIVLDSGHGSIRSGNVV